MVVLGGPPGRIYKIVSVDLARPRLQIETRQAPEFFVIGWTSMPRCSRPAARIVMRLTRLNLPGTMVIVAVGVLWEAAVRSGAVAYEYLPAPSGILVAGYDLLLSGEMLAQTAHTLRSVLIGWTIANVIGIGLGLVLGFSAFARRYFLASLEVLRPMPIVAFLPLALLLFNFSLTTESF